MIVGLRKIYKLYVNVFYPRPECAVEVAMRLESPTAVLTPQRKLGLLLYI